MIYNIVEEVRHQLTVDDLSCTLFTICKSSRRWSLPVLIAFVYISCLVSKISHFDRATPRLTTWQPTMIYASVWSSLRTLSKPRKLTSPYFYYVIYDRISAIPTTTWLWKLLVAPAFQTSRVIIRHMAYLSLTASAKSLHFHRQTEGDSYLVAPGIEFYFKLDSNTQLLTSYSLTVLSSVPLLTLRTLHTWSLFRWLIHT